MQARIEPLLAADPDTLTAPDSVLRTVWADNRQYPLLKICSRLLGLELGTWQNVRLRAAGQLPQSTRCGLRDRVPSVRFGPLAAATFLPPAVLYGLRRALWWVLSGFRATPART